MRTKSQVIGLRTTVIKDLKLRKSQNLDEYCDLLAHCGFRQKFQIFLLNIYQIYLNFQLPEKMCRFLLKKGQTKFYYR